MFFWNLGIFGKYRRSPQKSKAAEPARLMVMCPVIFVKGLLWSNRVWKAGILPSKECGWVIPFVPRYAAPLIRTGLWRLGVFLNAPWWYGGCNLGLSGKNNVEENHFNKNSGRVEVHPFSDHPLKQIHIWGWVKLPMKLPDNWGENHPATPATL